MTAAENVKLESLLSSLDKEHIRAAVQDTAPKEFDSNEHSLVADMLLKGCEEWLLDDLRDLDVLSIEEKREKLLPGAAEPMHFICDIEAIRKKDGKKLIIDHKTSKSDLDPKWQSYKEDSHQWKTYLWLQDADFFEYRGVNTQLKTRTVRLEKYEGLDAEMALYYEQTCNVRASLVGQVPWPRTMPGACRAFGRQCEYWRDCRKNTYPRDFLIPKSISPSAAETFWLCPERARRTELAKQNAGVDEEYTSDDYMREIGSAYHRGISEIWRQAFKL